MIQFADIENLNIHYSLDGTADNDTLLVLVNSLGTDLRIWDAMLAHIDFKPVVLRYDKRGHGLSDTPVGPYTIQDLSSDLTGLLGYLGIKKIILAGISVGGMIALDFAIRNPDMIQALILCDTGAKIGNAASWDDRIKAVQEQGLEPLADKILEIWFSPSYTKNNPAVIHGYRKMLTRTPAEGYTGTCAALRDADLRGQARTVAVETLVLTGSDDISTPLSLSEELQGLLPNSRLRVIQRAGHLTCVEQPASVANEINEFVRNLQ